MLSEVVFGKGKFSYCLFYKLFMSHHEFISHQKEKKSPGLAFEEIRVLVMFLTSLSNRFVVSEAEEFFV